MIHNDNCGAGCKALRTKRHNPRICMINKKLVALSPLFRHNHHMIPKAIPAAILAVLGWSLPPIFGLVRHQGTRFSMFMRYTTFTKPNSI